MNRGDQCPDECFGAACWRMNQVLVAQRIRPELAHRLAGPAASQHTLSNETTALDHHEGQTPTAPATGRTAACVLVRVRGPDGGWKARRRCFYFGDGFFCCLTFVTVEPIRGSHVQHVRG